MHLPHPTRNLIALRCRSFDRAAPKLSKAGASSFNGPLAACRIYPAAECNVQVYRIGQLLAPGKHGLLLVREQIAFCVENFEISAASG